MEHGLGRHAAAVEAGAAHLVLFDDRDLRAELGRADGRDIAAGAAADDQNGTGLGLLLRRGSGSRDSGRDRSTARARRHSFARGAKPADRRLARDGLARRDQDLQQDAVRLGFDVVGELVGGDRIDDLALLDGVSLFLLPLVDGTLGHGQAELRH